MIAVPTTLAMTAGSAIGSNFVRQVSMLSLVPDQLHHVTSLLDLKPLMILPEAIHGTFASI